MSIQREPPRGTRNARIVVRWREGSRHRSKSFPDTRAGKRQAQALDVAMSSHLKRGAFAEVEPSAITLGEWLDRWTDVYGPTWAVSTRRQRGSILDHDVAPHLEDVPLRLLGRARVQDWRRDLHRAGATAKTVNAATRVLSAALGAAVEEGLIPFNPTAKLKQFESPPVERDAIPLDIVEEIRQRMPTKQDRLIVSLMAYAGLRPAEVAGLNVDDVAEHQIHVRRSLGEDRRVKKPKTGGGRTIPTRREVWRDTTDEVLVGPLRPLLLGPRGGRHNHHNWHARIWLPVVTDMGINRVPYELRHTFASLCIAEGHTVVEVAAWMGHANPTMTLTRYAHLFAAHEASRNRRA